MYDGNFSHSLHDSGIRTFPIGSFLLCSPVPFLVNDSVWQSSYTTIFFVGFQWQDLCMSQVAFNGSVCIIRRYDTQSYAERSGNLGDKLIAKLMNIDR